MAELEEMKAHPELEAQNKALIKHWIKETDKGNFAVWDEVCSAINVSFR